MNVNGTADLAKNKIFYGWIVVIAASCIYAIGTGQSISFGIFIKPMAREFGWSRAAINAAFGLNMLVLAVFSLVSGILVDRFGPRRLNVFAGIAMAAGFYLCSKINELWQLYFAYSFLSGLGFSFIYITLFSTVPRWFIEKKGLAIGIVFAGAGVGSLILTPLLQYYIKHYGWRTSFVILSIISLCVIVVSALFLRGRPEEMGLLPLGADSTEPSGKQPEKNSQVGVKNYTLLEALKSRFFWLYAVSVLFMFIGLLMAQLNMVPNSTDKGIPPQTAALAMGLVGAFSSIGRLCMGAISDKIGSQKSFGFCLILGMITLFWLIAVKQSWMLFIFAAPFGFAFGGAVTQLPRIVSELFGVKNMGSIFGLTTAITAWGAVIGPYIGGVFYDRTGNYTLAFLAGGLAIFIGFILLQRIKFPKGNKGSI